MDGEAGDQSRILGAVLNSFPHDSGFHDHVWSFERIGGIIEREGV